MLSEFVWVTRAQMQLARMTQDFKYDWQHYAEILYSVREELDEFDEMTPEEIVAEDLSYWD